MGHAGCRDVLKMAAEDLGWEATLNSGGTVVWVDTESDAAQRMERLRSKDWLSWVPGVQEACGKISLSEALQTRGAGFWPRSWRLPEDVQRVCGEAFGTPTTLIVKPDKGSQGCGIMLIQSEQELFQACKNLPPEGAIVQEYVDRPLLLDGFKWDARIYALLMPLPEGGHAAFLLEEGLVRVCTEQYELPDSQNLQRSMVHLTNYSLNKFSQKYVHGEDTEDGGIGGKRTLSAVLQRLQATRNGFSVEKSWQALDELTQVTLAEISRQVQGAEPKLSRCFHLVGLDVLLDEAGKAWLLEANYKPSLLVDEVHPLPGGTQAEINRMMASQKRSGSKWGRPCRCSLLHSLHVHQLCPADVAAKCPAVTGALAIACRARSGQEATSWAEGTAYHMV